MGRPGWYCIRQPLLMKYRRMVWQIRRNISLVEGIRSDVRSCSLRGALSCRWEGTSSPRCAAINHADSSKCLDLDPSPSNGN